MSYNIEIIKKHQQKTSKWTGGTTNEIYIYPVESLYGERNFKWRISSAKIEEEHSTFTSLPGISRLIMVIEGKLLLKHEGHHNAELSPFEQDSFSGEWTTISSGKVIDFNLMLTQGYKGSLESISFYKGEVKDISLHNNENDPEEYSQIIEAFYVVTGNIQICTGMKEKTSLFQGDIAIVIRTEKKETTEFKIHSSNDEKTKIIKASIFYYE